MKTTNNSVKYKVLYKQYLPALLDISDFSVGKKLLKA